ncbi:phosphotransferase family protein [Sphingopyxis sp. 550A]
MTRILDAQKIFSGTIAVTGADALDETKLADWMRGNVAGFEGPLALSKFAGGQSNPTYKLSAPSGDYVLRRQPFGNLLPSAHAVDREFRVQRALRSAGLPVAHQYGLCVDEGVIGSWFYVMALVQGRTLWDGAMPDATVPQRRASYFAMTDTLAALHNVNVDRAGLAGFGREGNYFVRQIERWTKQYRLAETEPMPAMERLIRFLADSCPPQTRNTVVHGDYRIDNMIFARNAPEIRAILDWELSTIGDPLADFSYFAMAWVNANNQRSGVEDLDRKQLGIPELEEISERYCAATNYPSIPDLTWYFAFNFFRLAAIMQGIRRRYEDGTASSAHAKTMSERVPVLADRAWEFAVRAGA